MMKRLEKRFPVMAVVGVILFLGGVLCYATAGRLAAEPDLPLPGKMMMLEDGTPVLVITGNDAAAKHRQERRIRQFAAIAAAVGVLLIYRQFRRRVSLLPAVRPQ